MLTLLGEVELAEVEFELGELGLLFAIPVADPIQHHPVELQDPIRRSRGPGQSPPSHPPRPLASPWRNAG